jgi:hypothetical protein
MIDQGAIGETFSPKRLRAGYIYSPAGEKGVYRNSLGTVLCAVCQHYVFDKDDIKKAMAWSEYTRLAGFALRADMFWKEDTLIAPVKCPICKARYLAHCFGHCTELWLKPYNLSFFYSFAEQPAPKDLEEVDQARWLLDEPAPHLAGSRERRLNTREAQELAARKQPVPQQPAPKVEPPQPEVELPVAPPLPVDEGFARLQRVLAQGRLVAGE